MSFKVMADNNESISASQDGAMYNVFAGNKDFIIANIGNEMRVSYSSTSLSVSLGTGEAVLCGRHITAQGSNTLSLSASSSGYIALRYNNGVASLVATEALQTANINNGGSQRDMALGQYTTSSSGVTAFTDMRSVLSSAFPTTIETAVTAQNWSGCRYGESDPTDDIGNDGDLYCVI